MYSAKELEDNMIYQLSLVSFIAKYSSPAGRSPKNIQKEGAFMTHWVSILGIVFGASMKRGELQWASRRLVG